MTNQIPVIMLLLRRALRGKDLCEAMPFSCKNMETTTVAIILIS